LKTRTLEILGIFVLAVAVLSGTYALNMKSPSQTTHTETSTLGRIRVLATFYPMYDFTRNVGGDRIDLALLVPMTVDVHDFEPTPQAVRLVSTADVLVFSGAGLEPWVPQLISAADNPKLILVNSSIGIQPLLVPPQFQKDNRSVDPHIWLDPELAKIQVTNILRGLAQADPTDKDYFVANANSYEAKLDSLNQAILNATSNVKTRSFVTFHEAFAYFAKRYNLTQIAIAGPFEEEPTPSDIDNVIAAIKNKHLCYVGYESLENPAISQSIASQTQAKLVLMDPIEGLSEQDQAAGKTYLDKMYDTLQIFTMVLNSVGC
jgi:zinc transport system substrate-binding protein